jgi:hypothetical protein
VPGSESKNCFDDLGLSDEDSGTEHNTILLAHHQPEFNASDLNDFLLNCEEEKSIEPI